MRLRLQLLQLRSAFVATPRVFSIHRVLMRTPDTLTLAPALIAHIGSRTQPPWFWACNPGRPWWRKPDLVTDTCYWLFIPAGSCHVLIPASCRTSLADGMLMSRAVAGCPGLSSSALTHAPPTRNSPDFRSSDFEIERRASTDPASARLLADVVMRDVSSILCCHRQQLRGHHFIATDKRRGAVLEKPSKCPARAIAPSSCITAPSARPIAARPIVRAG